jgi:hypothetical protein
MMVDVGGGCGHQAKPLKDTFPNLPGKLVVQDLPQMEGKGIPGIEFQAHDFFLEQPIKGKYSFPQSYDQAIDLSLILIPPMRPSLLPSFHHT